MGQFYRKKHLILPILLIFLLLATLHSIIVPPTQGEDELAHYRYIRFIAQSGRLPATPAERAQAWYRADWPPFYHLLVGWAISPLDTSRPPLKDVGESPHRRLVGQIFYPRLLLYTADFNWPWQDGILAWHIGRFMSIGFSGVALYFVYRTALELFRRHTTAARPLALLTTALLAFTPRFVFTSAMLSDDSLFILLSAIFIWLLLRALHGEDSLGRYALMGLLLGLSIVTKYSTGLFPLAILPVVYWRWQQRSDDHHRWRRALSQIAVCWLCTLLGASWWFAWIGYHFNTINQDGLFFGLLHPLLASGPDVSMRRVFAFFGGGEFSGPPRPEAVAAGTWLGWVSYLFQTYWGVPVLEHDPLYPWAYLPLALLCLLSLWGLRRVWQHGRLAARRDLLLLSLITALLIPFPVLRFYLTHNILETGQGRHILYPAAQAIPILLIWGWQALNRPSRRLCMALPPILLLWSIGQLLLMAHSYPAPLPVRTTTFDPATIPHPLSHDFGPAIRLLGYDFHLQPETARAHLTLIWRARHSTPENYRPQIELLDATMQSRLAWRGHPVQGQYPTRAWDPGDTISDTITLPLSTLPAGRYTISLSMLPQATERPRLNKPLTLTMFEWPGAPPLPTDSRYHLWLPSNPARPRQTLPLTWQGDPATNWTLHGPNETIYPPQLTEPGLALFLIEPHWPSGRYHLYRAEQPTETSFWLANEARQFSLPEPPPAPWTPVAANFADQIMLHGYSLPQRRFQPGEAVPLSLIWQSLAPVQGDYVTFAVLLDETQTAHGNVDRYPQGFYSPMLWAEGEIVADQFTLPIAPTAPDGVYYLHVGLYELVAQQPKSLPLLNGDGQPTETTSVRIGPLKLGHAPADVTTDQPRVNLNHLLGGEINLLGYEQQQTAETLELTLYWQAETALNRDYTTFLHLRDPANQTVAQKDRPPTAGRYPTSLWTPGETIVDKISLPLSDLPPDEYTPVVGLYDFATGARLLTPGNPANEIALPPFTLKREPSP